MENDIIIRKAHIEDLKEVANIAVSGWKEAYRGIIEEEYLNNMSVEETYQKIKGGYQENKYIVAELKSEIVGFCRYTSNYSKSDENADGEIIALYVKPKLKYNGIGTKMFSYVMNEFKENGKQRIVLGCLKENYPSRKFYESMGGVAGKCKESEFCGKKYEIISYLFDLESELELVFPTKEMQNEIEEYMQEFYNNGDEVAGIGGLNRINDFNVWLDKVQKDRLPKTCESERVPASLYFSVRKSDKKIVGNLQIRHSLNEKLLQYGGHIGDSVRPSERRKGYATEQIRLALLKCKELGIDRVLMDCDKNNIGSAKAIKNNGGILENEIYVEDELVQRYWITLKKRYADRHVGKKNKKAIYKMKSVNSEVFIGDVVYYKFEDVTQKIIIPNGTPILDTGYEWLEFYNYNSKIKLTALYNNNKEIIEWYFDIAKEIGKENGIPYEDDLYLDVVVNPNGEITLLDEDELKMSLDRLEITQGDYDMAYSEANKLMEKLKGNTDRLDEFSKKYLDEMR